MLSGFDFSHWNSDLQVQKYFQQADFVCHKMSEGSSYTDPKAFARAKFFNGSKPVIWYHLVRPDKGNQPETEAKYFVNDLKKITQYGMFGIALDLEVMYVPNTLQMLEWVIRCVREVRKAFEQPVFIYMGDLYAKAWYDRLSMEECVFWIARYRETMPDHQCVLWQNTDKFNGEQLDHNECYVDLKTLWLLCGSDDVDKVIKQSGFTPEEIAEVVLGIIRGEYGSGDERKAKLGNKYNVAQKVVNIIFSEV